MWSKERKNFIMKMTNEQLIKNKKGITLIALVVTVVVLLILAGISINMIFSQDGIIDKAHNVKNTAEEAQKSDEEAINSLLNQLDEIVNSEGGSNPAPPTVSGFTVAGSTLGLGGMTRNRFLFFRRGSILE